jgi:hypothetical protein
MRGRCPTPFRDLFGAVPEPLRARIFAADLASIETRFDRAIEATEFESVSR